MAKPDMTALFRKAAENRKAEQALAEQTIQTKQIDNMIEAEETKLGRRPKYKKDDPKKTVTLSMTSSRHDRLKEYAFRKKMTVSDIIGEYIDSLEI